MITFRDSPNMQNAEEMHLAFSWHSMVFLRNDLNYWYWSQIWGNRSDSCAVVPGLRGWLLGIPTAAKYLTGEQDD